MSWENLSEQVAGKKHPFPIILFIVFAVLHLLLFHWFIHLRLPLKIFYQDENKEKIIEVVPVPPQKIRFTGEAPPLTPPPSARTINAKPPDTGQPAESKPGTGTGNQAAAPTTPVLQAPPADSPLPSPPNLSIYSENMQNILKNFDRRRTGKVTPGSPETSGEDAGSSTSDYITGPGGQSRAFFNIRNYNLYPWAKQALLIIQKNWTIPFVPGQKNNSPVEIAVVIEKNGAISFIKMKKSSDIEALDRAALNALRSSSPFPQLPDDFPNKNLEASFKFNYPAARGP